MRQRWSPTEYRRHGLLIGVPDALILEGLRIAHPPQERHLPAILNLAHLARMSGTSEALLRQVVTRVVDPYRDFSIRKRNGRRRWISVPVGEVHTVQSWLHENLLTAVPPSPYSYSFWPKKSIGAAAKVHAGCKWLVKVDIERFFDSVTEIQVYRAFRRLAYPALVSLQLARLCTRVLETGRDDAALRFGRFLYSQEHRKAHSKQATAGYVANADPEKRIGSLPQGAPTSPLLAELASQQLDEDMVNHAFHFGVEYTRYADDLCFSTTSDDFSKDAASQLISTVYRTLLQHDFRPNQTKTVIAHPGSRKIVLGLLCDQDSPCLTNEFRDRVRQHIYYAMKYGPQDHAVRRGFDSVIGFKNHLCGLISYARSVDAAWAAKRLVEFNKITWPL